MNPVRVSHSLPSSEGESKLNAFVTEAGCTPDVTTTVPEYPAPCAGLHWILVSENQADDSQDVDPTRAIGVLSYVPIFAPVTVTCEARRAAEFESDTEETTAASYVNTPVTGPAICLPKTVTIMAPSKALIERAPAGTTQVIDV